MPPGWTGAIKNGVPLPTAIVKIVRWKPHAASQFGARLPQSRKAATQFGPLVLHQSYVRKVTRNDASLSSIHPWVREKFWINGGDVVAWDCRELPSWGTVAGFRHDQAIATACNRFARR
jgi:hypothetical protein